jgi:hypothetical protein
VLGIILSHRVALILVVLSSATQVVLPRVLTEPDDESFVSSFLMWSQRVVWLSLSVLVISGLIRLSLGVPIFLFLKLLIVGITLVFTVLGPHQFPPHQFRLIQLVLILLTALTGLLLGWLPRIVVI